MGQFTETDDPARLDSTASSVNRPGRRPAWSHSPPRPCLHLQVLASARRRTMGEDAAPVAIIHRHGEGGRFARKAATAARIKFYAIANDHVPRRGAGDYAPYRIRLTPDVIQKDCQPPLPTHTHTGAFIIAGSDVTPSRDSAQNRRTHFPLIRDRLENSMYAMHGIPPALSCRTAEQERQCAKLSGKYSMPLLKPLGALVLPRNSARS